MTIPVARLAPPKRIWPVWIIVVIIGLGLVVLAGLFGLGYLVGRRSGNEQPARAGQNPDIGQSRTEDVAPKDDGKLGSKNADEWGWQDLQDYLAKKKIPTSRAPLKDFMIFTLGDGKPLDLVTTGLEDHEYRAILMRDSFVFTAKMATNCKQARLEAATSTDVNQREAISIGRFVIQGSPKTVTILKTILSENSK